MTPTNKELRKTLITEYLRTVLDQLTKRRHNSRSLQQLGRALEVGLRASRTEEGLPNEIVVQREAVATFEDAVDILVAEQAEEEAEEA